MPVDHAGPFDRADWLSDNITTAAAVAAAIHNSGSSSSDASAVIQTGTANTQTDCILKRKGSG